MLNRLGPEVSLLLKSYNAFRIKLLADNSFQCTLTFCNKFGKCNPFSVITLVLKDIMTHLLALRWHGPLTVPVCIIKSSYCSDW